MSIAVLEIRRAFRYNGILLPDVPGLEPREVRDLYSAQYPELVSAEVEPGEVRDGVQEFNFRKAVGTKGACRKSARTEAEGGEAGPRLAVLLANIQANEAGAAGEGDEEAALDMMCEEDDEADREAMRDEMVTRRMLDTAYPKWARRWLVRPEKGVRRRKDGSAWRACDLRRATKTLADPRMRAVAADALALSRLPLDDSFRPDIDGEYIAFGAVLSWDEGDVTTRIYDDLLNLAHQAEYCDRMGEALIPLDDPGALEACFTRLGMRFEAIALIDRLICGLCE